MLKLVSTISILSILILDTSAAPGTPGTYVFTLDRRAHRTSSPTLDATNKIFDSNFAKKEIRSVLSKYQQAPKFLHGVQISPDRLASAGAKPVDAIPPPKSVPLDGAPNLAKQATVELTDYMSGTLDVLYYARMQFGTPAQTLTIDIDTGSADLWVPGGCDSCQTKEFIPSESTTFHGSSRPFTVFYGTGSVSGHLAQDRVAMGGLTVDRQDLGIITSQDDALAGSPTSGLIGMAFSNVAVSQKPTFFENLVKGDKLSAEMFSVHLARNQVSGSELCLGCMDMTKAMGPTQWVPLVSRSYWAIEVSGIQIMANATLPVQIIAAIDTGTTLIYVPDSIASALYRSIPGAKPADQYGDGFWTYPCSAALNLGFVIDGYAYTISPSDFNLGHTYANSPDCVGGILSLGDGFPSNFAILGDEFIKSWYTTFDYTDKGHVGFAPSINNRMGG
ncbi:hypothetical protein BS47DRAFT_1332068 [Hydnum rufescens UP504]|uniref:Peptidase A1 domain-containing protein n=1 Tax=Hydnum rufescens UP504 TaxID=1448309 RepID=A0A9P6AQ15_9AGAM|nr:hypothetical protein BS47DRAFT_1332068 [Hydnum rufescens UP504]